MNDQLKWAENNDKYLSALLTWIRLKLRRLNAVSQNATEQAPKISQGWFRRNKSPESVHLSPTVKIPSKDDIDKAYQNIVEMQEDEFQPALKILANNLGLSDFECHVLALCLGMELDTRFSELCARAQGDPNKPYPTFALAFALFDNPDWSVLSPQAPLRYWRLLEINQPGTLPLISASLGVDERIVNYLKGINYLDDRLNALLTPVVVDRSTKLPVSQQNTVDVILNQIKYIDTVLASPVIELSGANSNDKRQIAAKVASSLGCALYSAHIKTIPNQSGDFETFVRLWHRESLLLPLALFLDLESSNETDLIQLKRLLDLNNTPVFLDVRDSTSLLLKNRFTINIDKPTPKEQQQLWSQALGNRADGLSQHLAEQFSFSQYEIERLVNSSLSAKESEKQDADDLWQSCRLAARASMDQLAQRIDAKATWEQLILPAEHKSMLKQIADQVAQRNRVYEDWGFRHKLNRGLGISALFTGESGTGKTMAAEVIANALKLDLYRIDLSAVVSKYIGETEKNLRKLFAAAEDSGAILFFDEADALFGKRSEVKDSHDRYANIEINYLLQRMESYRGLAVLATNMKSALDKAFVRRLRFILDFPFPDADHRKLIWQNVFPPQTPVDENLDYEHLAKLNLTGGNIHNVALNAAFLAANEGKQAVSMPLILNAARTEFKKMERPTKESDFQWQGPTSVAL